MIKLFRYLLLFILNISIIKLYIESSPYNKPKNENTVTVTMMTCNRLSLLKRSIESFALINPDIKIVLLIDCYNKSVYNYASSSKSVKKILKSTTKIKNIDRRIMHNLQALSNEVNTHYWLHLEDDWIWNKNGFIEISKFILDNNPNVWQVIGRGQRFLPKKNETFGWMTSQNGTRYGILKYLSGPGGSYCSFTLNPSLFRTNDMKNTIKDFTKFRGEHHISRVIGKKYRDKKTVAILETQFYKHLGDRLSTKSKI